MLTHLLNQSATLKTKSGFNEYGRETLNAGSSFKCRFEKVTKTRLLPNGNTQRIDGFLFVEPDLGVNNDDIVTFSSTDYKVVGTDVMVDGKGDTRHKELQVERWRT